MHVRGRGSEFLPASCRVPVSAFAGTTPAVVAARAASSSYAAGLLAHLVEAGAHGAGAAAAAADAAVEPAPERARVHGRRAEARAGAPRQVELLRGGRPRRGDARGGSLVRGGGGGAATAAVVVVPRRRRAGVEQGLLLIRQRDLLDRRRPVRLQMIPHGRPNTRAPTILINRFLLGGKKNPSKPRTGAN